MSDELTEKRRRLEAETISTWICIGCGKGEPDVTFRNSSLMGSGHVGGLNALPVCDICWMKKD